MVPPMLSMSNMSALHMEANPSAKDRVPMTKMDMSMRLPVMARMEYLFME